MARVRVPTAGAVVLSEGVWKSECYVAPRFCGFTSSVAKVG